MTQIVYDGNGMLLADRVLYRGNSITQHKKLNVVHGKYCTYAFAFAGDIYACGVGEYLLTQEAKGFPVACGEAENKLSYLSPEMLYENYYGILLMDYPVTAETPKLEVGEDANLHKVYLVNYLGDRVEVNKHTPIAVGAMSEHIEAVFRTLSRLGSHRLRLNVPTQKSFLETIVTGVTKGSQYDGSIFPYDVYEVNPFGDRPHEEKEVMNGSM